MEKRGWCRKCGNPVEEGRSSCPRCGARLRPAKSSLKTVKKALRFSRPLRPSPAPLPGALSPTEPLPLDTIICGDCVEVMSRFPSGSVDLVVTSPPYNFGLDDYQGYRDTREWEDYFARLAQAFRECYRVLKEGGRICVVVQPLFSDYIPTHHRISHILSRIGFLFQAEILWEKHNYNAKYTAWGSWKSPSMPYLKYTWEFIEVFAKGSRRKSGPREAIDITADEFKRWVYARWDIAPETRMKEFGHPSMFPEEVPERLIKLFSYRGDVVLDPFNGAGTTTLVAWRLGRRYIGIDISERYCQVALTRLKKAQERSSQLPLQIGP